MFGDCDFCIGSRAECKEFEEAGLARPCEVKATVEVP